MSEASGGRVALDAELQQLVEDHLWLADIIARELGWLSPKTIDGDVVQPARLGLAKAALRFDPARRDTFVGYARKWIVGEVFDAVDRRYPGFTATHRAALEICDQAEEAAGPAAPEEPDTGSADLLDAAAVEMGLSSASVRLSRGASNELARILDEELSRYPPEERALFVGHFLDGVEWQVLAQEVGVSTSTAKRRVAAMRVQLIARLRARGVRGASG